jgi:hypothetical protein
VAQSPPLSQGAPWIYDRLAAACPKEPCPADRKFRGQPHVIDLLPMLSPSPLTQPSLIIEGRKPMTNECSEPFWAVPRLHFFRS